MNEAEAVMESLVGFAIGDKIAHIDAPNTVGTIVGDGYDKEKQWRCWLVEWNDGKLYRYYEHRLFHVRS